MKSASILWIPVVLFSLAFVFPACGGENEETPNIPIHGDTQEPPENVVITIGNLTDRTGPSSNAMSIIDMSFEDLVEYYNEENIIPGVDLKVVSYDSEYSPSRFIPGYQWLRERGADLIFTPLPGAPPILKPLCDEEEVVLFGAAASYEGYLPPGYTFCGSVSPDHLMYTLLKWIAENDWDYEKKGPAKLGAAGWVSPMVEQSMAGMEEYCTSHPEQFKWVGGYLSNLSFVWSAEVEALKDCDYVYPPMASQVTFAKEFRSTGSSSKFIGNEPHLAYMRLIDDADIWDELDGMLVASASRWWNEEGQLIDLAKRLLHDNHSGSANDVMEAGCGYLAVNNVYIMLEIIRQAVESVGPQNFNSQALYNAAQSYSLNLDGIERYSFSDSKRFSTNYIGIYEFKAASKDIFRADPEWQEIVREP